MNDPNAKRILLNYEGAISQETVVDLGARVRSELADTKKARRIFSVFIELAHNVLHYSAERRAAGLGEGKSVGVGTISVMEYLDYFELRSTNLIENEAVALLESKCNHLLFLSKDELKKRYKEKRRSGPDLMSKGASLGLIEIARISDRPIIFEFHQVDDRHSRFSLAAQIEK